MQRRRLISIGAALLTAWASTTFPASADTSCSESAVRDRLTELAAAIQTPKSRAVIIAATKDYQEDGSLGTTEHVNYFTAVRAFLGAQAKFDTGNVNEACMTLKESEKAIDVVLADQR